MLLEQAQNPAATAIATRRELTLLSDGMFSALLCRAWKATIAVFPRESSAAA
jgi:hypothetical protein